MMLVIFKIANTHRWGGLYTNSSIGWNRHVRSKRSRVHTKLATAGLGRELSAWVITIQGNNGWCFDERTGTSLKCWNGDRCLSVQSAIGWVWSVIDGKVRIWPEWSAVQPLQLWFQLVVQCTDLTHYTFVMPRNPSESLAIGQLITPGQIRTLPSIHWPYPSIADWHTQASVPIPHLRLVPVLSSKHQPLFPCIVITHADSSLPNPAVANFVCTLDLLLPHACFPRCLELV